MAEQTLKTVEVEGVKYAALAENGNPIYVDDKGAETGLDALGMFGSIGRLRSEAQGHREGKEEAQAKLQAFEGIDDPVKALKALETVQNLSDKKLVDSGEVEAVRKAAQADADLQVERSKKLLKEANVKLDQVQNDRTRERLTNQFAASDFVLKGSSQHSSVIESTFAGSFKLEDNRFVGKDAHGKTIYSKVNLLEIASFDEALEAMVSAHPGGDSMRKASGHNGSGAPALDANGNRKRTMTMDDFSALPPAEQHKIATGSEVTVVP